MSGSIPKTGKAESVFLLSLTLLLVILDLMYLFFINMDPERNIVGYYGLRLIVTGLGLICPIIITVIRYKEKFFTDDDIWYREKFVVHFGLFYAIFIMIFQIGVNFYIIICVLVNDKKGNKDEDYEDLNAFIYLGLAVIMIFISVALLLSWIRMKNYSNARVDRYEELPKNINNLNKKITINENKDNINNEQENDKEHLGLLAEESVKKDEETQTEFFSDVINKEEDQEDYIVINIKKKIKINDYENNNKREKISYLSLKKYGNTNTYVLCEHNKNQKINFENFRLIRCQHMHKEDKK